MAFHSAMQYSHRQHSGGFEGFQRNELGACIAAVKVMNGESETFSSKDMRGFRGNVHMTSAKFSDFLTPLSAFSRNLPYKSSLPHLLLEYHPLLCSLQT